jgi:hypothetical protein
VSVTTPAAAPVVALVGNPNCGKTALFNALTGSRQKVANYPGVTVEKKVGPLTTPAGRTVRIVDLPGTYSLRARSPDEEPAPGAPARARAEAGGAAGHAVAQHDGHRAQARHRDRHREARS